MNTGPCSFPRSETRQTPARTQKFNSQNQKQTHPETHPARQQKRLLIHQIKRMQLGLDLLLSGASVLRDVRLQVHLEIGVEGGHPVLAREGDDRINGEDEVGLDAGLGGLASAVAGGRADHQVVLLLVSKVDDAVPEPRRVHQHVTGIQHRGVAFDLAQPGGGLGASLAHEGLGVGREALGVDGGLEVRGLGNRDEPPLLLASDLAENVDANSAVDVGTHVRHAHEHLRLLAVARLQAADLLVVDHVVQLGVVVKDDRGAGDVEGLASAELLEEFAHRAVIDEVKQCTTQDLLVSVLGPEVVLVPGVQSRGIL
eukprot:Colp12_sorted_trinity150504_noHs@22676